MSIITAEIIGTTLLIVLGCGVNAAVTLSGSKAKDSGWIAIAFGWGFAVMVGAYAVGHYDGAHLNPAITLGLWIHGDITGAMAWRYFVGEMVGALLGAALVWAAYYLHWKPTDDAEAKLGVFSTMPAIRNYPFNLLTEIIGTAVLVFAVLAITGPNNPGPAESGLNTLLVAFLVVAIGLSLGGPTGYAINPARDLGPRIVHAVMPIPGKGSSDWAYSWVPVLGPMIGGAIGALIFGAAYPF